MHDILTYFFKYDLNIYKCTFVKTAEHSSIIHWICDYHKYIYNNKDVT